MHALSHRLLGDTARIIHATSCLICALCVQVELNEKNAWDIPIHVDAASGGFVAPFIQPDLLWDFRLPNVKSINVSGHKYGLVYAGIGWLCFREKKDLHEGLVRMCVYTCSHLPMSTHVRDASLRLVAAFAGDSCCIEPASEKHLCTDACWGHNTWYSGWRPLVQHTTFCAQTRLISTAYARINHKQSSSLR